MRYRVFAQACWIQEGYPVETLAEYRDLDKLRGIVTHTDREQVTSLPEAIRACRKGRLTQDDLTAKAGIAQSTLSQWENGKSAPDALQLRMIEAACERPAGWISVQAGLLDTPTSVAEAVAMAPELDDGQRRIIMDVYRGFTDPQS
jgi:transcriptional regulator with XRE-family HTH domain